MPGELVVAVSADPQRFIPGPIDDATALLSGLLYDPLYRLDRSLVPQPAVASALPEVSDDGLTWTVPIRTGGSFHTGGPITAGDAAFSLRLAMSGACPFARDLCAAVAANVKEARAIDPARLQVVLRAPWAPLLSQVLGALPVLSEDALREATAEVRDAASRLDAATLRESIDRITAETNAERCLVTAPPSGCRLADHTAELEEILAEARVAPPPAERSAAADGEIDEEDHAAALLQVVVELAGLLGAEGMDGFAAAVPLVDVARRPLGGGPFRLEAYEPGASVALLRHEGHVPVPASLERIRMVVMRDPAVAATALRAGDVDWIARVAPDQMAALAAEPDIRAAAHPEPMIRSIVFNVRPGRVYSDPVTRRAFSLCLDRAAAATAVPGWNAIPAVAETSIGSWALDDAAPAIQPDPAAAVALLERSGWQRGSDGIFARAGVRLRSDVGVRTGRPDLLAFLQTVADQLRGCGIELEVRELDLSTDVLLRQLQWPNDFETLLVARALDSDPAVDLAAFESSRVTSADNPVDSNPGGYASAALDAILAEARRDTDPETRTALYAQGLTLMAQDPPSVPILYDASHAAISHRVTGTEGEEIDPGAPRYAWDLWSWQRSDR